MLATQMRLAGLSLLLVSSAHARHSHASRIATLDRTTLITLDLPIPGVDAHNKSLELTLDIHPSQTHAGVINVILNNHTLSRDGAGAGSGSIQIDHGHLVEAIWEITRDVRPAKLGQEELRVTVESVDGARVDDTGFTVELRQNSYAWIASVEGNQVSGVSTQLVEAAPKVSGDIASPNKDADSRIDELERLVTEIAQLQLEISSRKQQLNEAYDAGFAEFGEPEHRMHHCDTLSCFANSLKEAAHQASGPGSKHNKKNGNYENDGHHDYKRSGTSEHEHQPRHHQTHHEHNRHGHQLHDEYTDNAICYPQAGSWASPCRTTSDGLGSHVFTQEIFCFKPSDDERGLHFSILLVGFSILSILIITDLFVRRRLAQRKAWLRDLCQPAIYDNNARRFAFSFNTLLGRVIRLQLPLGTETVQDMSQQQDFYDEKVSVGTNGISDCPPTIYRD